MDDENDVKTEHKLIRFPSKTSVCGCPHQDPGASLADSPICNGLLMFMIFVQNVLSQQCDIAEPCKRVVGINEADDEYDFVVVGAGVAGSVVAGRLSENAHFKVLLLEAGGPDPITSRVPSFYRSFWNNPETDWMYRTVPSQNYCLSEGSKGCSWPRGKAMGGSGVLNGMLYHRGHIADYDDWVHFGAKGWSWEENLPYFYKSEDNRQIGTLVDGRFHATGGPLPVQQFKYQPEILFDLLQAIHQNGIPVLSDLNNPHTPVGMAVAQMVSDDGQRVTTARAYLRNKHQRPNLSVLVKAQVTKVLFDGNQAIGVEYFQHGELRKVYASKEVILSAGALNSPQLLMLSGIGPRKTLDSQNIPVITNLPVGYNLRNHFGVTFNFILEKLVNRQTLDWTVLSQYLANRTGPMSADGITQMTGTLYSSLADSSRDQPDLQFFFNGFYAECSSSGKTHEPVGDCAFKGTNISVNAVSLLPRSVGFMTLNSSNPLDPPLFYPNYFGHPDDLTMVKDGATYIHDILYTRSMQEKYGIILDKKFSAPCQNFGDEWSGNWLECMIRVNTDPQNHQIGTAAISRVIDTRLRVYNVKGLRVIDAASLPTQLSGNPQAAIIMLAERGAAMIKDDWSY